MATLTGAASFKKKQGMISIFEEQTPPMLVWKLIDSNVEIKEVSIQLDQVTNLQATALTSNKIALNIITGEKKNVFSFGSRDVMNNIKLSLQQIRARLKQDLESSLVSTPVPQLPILNDEFLLNLLDAKKLLKNHQLQQKLLKENKNLMNTFREAVMNNGLDPQEFWNTRIHLLRSYAIQNNQKKGSYNVLSTIKPVATSDNEVNVSVTREKIHSIFEQYPIVRKIYNDNVPKMFGEGVFWSRFFSSKLFRRLRGEKNFNNAKVDAIFDKYLYVDPDYEGSEDQVDEEAEKLSLDLHHVNKFIDLTGNEEDVSERMGNGPDYTMKFDKGQEVVNVLKSMNRLSRKMMSNISIEDPELENDDDREQELELLDLEDKEEPEYNELMIKKNSKRTRTVDQFEIDKSLYLEFIQDSKREFDTNIELDQIVNSPELKKQIMELTREISTLIRLNARQSKQSWQVSFQPLHLDEMQPAKVGVEEEESPLGEKLSENLRLCHSTSIEFLRHFWLNLQDPTASDKIVKNLYQGLQKSVNRIDSIIGSVTVPEDAKLATLMLAPLKDSLEFAINYFEKLIDDAKAQGDLKHKTE